MHAQALFRMGLDLFHDLVRIPIVEVVGPAAQAAVHISHHLLQSNGSQFPPRQRRQLRLEIIRVSVTFPARELIKGSKLELNSVGIYL